MTDTDQNAVVTVPAQINDNLELTELKLEADALGLTYHPRIGLKKLQKRITNYKLEQTNKTTDAVNSIASPLKYIEPVISPEMTKAIERNNLRKEATKLVRIRVTCMNPDKREWKGEIFTASNSLIGTHKKYVPFNNDEGWHIPQIILNTILERKCQMFYNSIDSHGQTIKKAKLISEFAVEILPHLTSKEFTDLATRQAISHSIDN